MDITQIYAMAMGGFFLTLIALNCRPYIEQAWKRVAGFTSKYLTYPYLFRRHHVPYLWTIGPWTPADILIQAVYVTANLFCLCFRASSMPEAGVRARELALVNLIPVSAGPHLSFLADVLGVSLSTYKLLHRSAGLMSSALTLFHVLTTVSSRASFSLVGSAHIFGFVVEYVRHPLLASEADYIRAVRRLGY
jgi:hypothetical protein